ncbi:MULTISPECIES: aa3-type cytochrome c oxidase subunit IV [unclassified Ancylobacter]|uniref:aa3-type cytochrome c oxidase subunit IV n=1 Tax=unclassified Ancylobacter TaxID=2626613 RepID=UPI0022707FA4|nr:MULTISPECIES: aa3-type cytochrome c oxidase subunit IV [unclassified Ancylobacter]WAC27627.1 aa3-type cytochrome c oxidase subunit IV [Ancylobacter sp. SL191]WGD30050.1 aa3-type cytochrome c oxidase subunit IV [Ancylobacter sp. WKF20]
MADHGAPEYATATGNDYGAHKGTYHFFVKFTLVSTVALCCFMIAFAIGGVNGHWGLFTLGTLASCAVAAIGLASENGQPKLLFGLLGLLLLTLIITS